MNIWYDQTARALFLTIKYMIMERDYIYFMNPPLMNILN